MPRKGIVKTVIVIVITEAKQRQEEPFGDFVKRIRKEYVEGNQNARGVTLPCLLVCMLSCLHSCLYL
jgi:hypothetical protein